MRPERPQGIQAGPACQDAGTQGDGGGNQGVDGARALPEGFPHAAGPRAGKAHGDEDLARARSPARMQAVSRRGHEPEAASTARAAALKARLKKRAVPPKVPSRESFMISSLRSCVTSTGRPSPQSATPSRCNPPVTATQQAQPMTPQRRGEKRREERKVSPPTSPPTTMPTSGSHAEIPFRSFCRGHGPTGRRVRKPKAERMGGDDGHLGRYSISGAR